MVVILCGFIYILNAEHCSVSTQQRMWTWWQGSRLNSFSVAAPRRERWLKSMQESNCTICKSFSLFRFSRDFDSHSPKTLFSSKNNYLILTSLYDMLLVTNIKNTLNLQYVWYCKLNFINIFILSCFMELGLT